MTDEIIRYYIDRTTMSMLDESGYPPCHQQSVGAGQTLSSLVGYSLGLMEGNLHMAKSRKKGSIRCGTHPGYQYLRDG